MIIPKGHDYKNLLFIFNNKPYVKMIIPATNDDKKNNKLHYYYFYFTPTTNTFSLQIATVHLSPN